MAKLMSFPLKKGAIDVLLMSKRLTLTSVAPVIYLLKWLNTGLLARYSSNPKIYNSYLGKIKPAPNLSIKNLICYCGSAGRALPW